LHRTERDLDIRMGYVLKAWLGRMNFVPGGGEIAEGVFAPRPRTCHPGSVIGGDITQRQHDVGHDSSRTVPHDARDCAVEALTPRAGADAEKNAEQRADEAAFQHR